MKIISIEYKVYTYDELTKNAKEKALQKFIEDNDYYFLEEYLTNYLQQFLGENNMVCDNIKLYYSLSCCQGDGVMFEGVIEWKNRYIVTVKQIGHYYHFNSKMFDIEEKDGEEITNYNEIEKELNYIYVSICKKLEKYGYSYIKNEDSEETFICSCKNNKYTFLENGEMFNV